MGKRRYPPLSLSEVRSILEALRFTLKRQDGSHQQYERAAQGQRVRAIVTLDVSVSSFGEFLLRSMIRQSTFSREEFYGATEKTKRKIQPSRI